MSYGSKGPDANKFVFHKEDGRTMKFPPNKFELYAWDGKLKAASDNYLVLVSTVEDKRKSYH